MQNLMHIPIDISAAASWLGVGAGALIAWFMRREISKADAWRHRIETQISELDDAQDNTMLVKEINRNERTSEKAHERLDSMTERLTILETRVAYIVVDRPE